MNMISILLPTYGRSERLQQVFENIKSTTSTEHEVIWVLEDDDKESQRICAELHPSLAVINQRKRFYGGAINYGYQFAKGEFLFTGADDLRFYPGWDEQVLSVMYGHVRVGGTNDLLHPWVPEGRHATHYLVDRRYIEEVGCVPDEPPGTFMPEVYDGLFTDAEVIMIAKARGVFAPCLSSVVEHLNFAGGRSEFDSTYRKAHDYVSSDLQLHRDRAMRFLGMQPEEVKVVPPGD
jgi:glycosyltransferase involved in cell wall biosynthesis